MMKESTTIHSKDGRVYKVYVVNDDVIRIRCVFDRAEQEEDRSYILKEDVKSSILETRR